MKKEGVITIIKRTVLFWGKRHPYMAVWDMIWLLGCVWNFIKNPQVLWPVLFAIVVLAPMVAKKIYRTLDEFASPSVKRKNLHQKWKTEEEWKEYLQK